MQIIHFLRIILIFTFLMGLPSFIKGEVYASQPSISQRIDKKDDFFNNALSLSIFPFINNGIGVQYDRAIVNNNWIRIAPIYYSTINYATLRKSDIQYMQGFDLGLYHIYDYFKDRQRRYKLSLQYGILYGQNAIRTAGDINTHIKKWGIDIMLNVRKMMGKNFFFDFYIGYGNRWSNAKASGPITKKNNGKYDQMMFDYGYSGSLFNVGFNLGIAF